MPIVDSVEINRPADQVWAYVADYRNDTSWRANVRQMHPSRPGPAQVGVTTHEALRLLGLSFRTDASIDRVEAGRLLQWRAHDQQKQLQGSRLVEPTSPTSSRFTEVVEGGLLQLEPRAAVDAAAAAVAQAETLARISPVDREYLPTLGAQT